MVWITGDTHADFSRFSVQNFPDQREMTKADIVIICGDFGGVWVDTKEERYWLDWLNDKPFTTLFVDGNHENFDRLNSEFPLQMFNGGKVHWIRSYIMHLMRGEIYQIQGFKFFTFGGASSHDIRDGVLNPADYNDISEFKRVYRSWKHKGKQFRVQGYSWWPQEIASQEEFENGKTNLSEHNNEVDFVITHCLPQEVASVFSMGLYEPDAMTMYFNGLLHNGLKFKHWYCGHYHIDRRIMGKFDVLYEKMVRII